MTPSTKDLIEEHGGIMVMLKVMEEIANRMERQETVDYTHLERIVEFLQIFADKCHHGKEEDVLFPELARNPENVLAVNQLLGEHQAARDLIGGIVVSLANCQPGTPEAVHMTINMKEYVNLLTNHIVKENEQLFQLADQQLPPTMYQSMQDRYDQLEAEIMSVGKLEEYQNWLNELKAIYLAN